MYDPLERPFWDDDNETEDIVEDDTDDSLSPLRPVEPQA